MRKENNAVLVCNWREMKISNKNIIKFILCICAIVLLIISIKIYFNGKIAESHLIEDKPSNVRVEIEKRKYGYVEILNEINKIGDLKITQIQNQSDESGNIININVDYIGDYNYFDKVYTKISDIECLYEVKYIKVNLKDRKISMNLNFLKTK
ncbi:MAG: hypothetical protein Q8936_01550 [Bacillota bacterium]|nr:hypothetical protein [Bacillota bacterium]